MLLTQNVPRVLFKLVHLFQVLVVKNDVRPRASFELGCLLAQAGIERHLHLLPFAFQNIFFVLALKN